MTGSISAKPLDSIEFTYRHRYGHVETLCVYDLSNINVNNGNFIINSRTSDYVFHIQEVLHVKVNGREISVRDLYERIRMRISRYSNIDSMGRYIGSIDNMTRCPSSLDSQSYNQKQLQNTAINNTTVEGTVKLKEKKFSDLETIFFLNECRN